MSTPAHSEAAPATAAAAVPSVSVAEDDGKAGDEKAEVSKNAAKRLAKQAAKEATKVAKAASKVVAASVVSSASSSSTAVPDSSASSASSSDKKKKKEDAADDDDVDPTAYFDQRVRELTEMRAAGKHRHLYPHKFHASMSVPQFVWEFSQPSIAAGQRLSREVSVAGRVYTKRSSGSALYFYDVQAQGARVQVVAGPQVGHGRLHHTRTHQERSASTASTAHRIQHTAHSTPRTQHSHGAVVVGDERR